MKNNKKILIVEDDYLNRRFIKNILLEKSYQIYEAKNVTEAIALLEKENLDLAILDIHLGENAENGISLAHKIKAQFKIPFLYLMAYHNDEIIGEAAATMPNSYLTKPFKNIDLIASLELILLQEKHKISQPSVIVVKYDDFQVDLPLDEVCYLESEGNYLWVYTATKKYKMRATIKYILEILPKDTFVQVHRAFIVNRLKIEAYNQKLLRINNVEIPISRNYTDALFVK